MTHTQVPYLRYDEINQWYARHLLILLNAGSSKADRTGTGTLSVHGASARFNLLMGFPLLALKKTNWGAACEEMEWFLGGACSNVSGLHARGVHIWDEWADERGNLGPIYGCQWRTWPTPDGPVDQIEAVQDALRNDPFSRRIIVEGWNVSDLPAAGVLPQGQAAQGRMALPPCHKSWQVLIRQLPDGRHFALDLVLYQRSMDVFLGAPFNICQYAFLAHKLVAWADAHSRVLNPNWEPNTVLPGDLIVDCGDLHLYKNHVEQAHEVVDRYERKAISPNNRPRLVFNQNVLGTSAEDSNLWSSQRVRDFTEILDYHPLPFIKGDVSV